MIAILSLLLILALSIIITRIATIALSHTGLSRESARFQARSAFTGVGFTTNESERVVNHPVRRRILLLLMLLGNAGVVTAMSSLVLTFITPTRFGPFWARIVILVGGLALLWGLSTSSWFDARLSDVVDWALRRYTNIEVKDYAAILSLARGYRISEVKIRQGDWLAERMLKNCRLKEEGINVLGVHRKRGGYVGSTAGETVIHAGDRIVAYGRIDAIKALEARRKGIDGEIAHNEAVAEQRKTVESEKQK